ncbi:serine/threonine-protein kinase 10 [Trichomycterus rosablanca]|uniref:serine/threonine-protein kinase 10 n=1 Tax=Trichomycterus rosablanca TaxID=2290929 RepID=UPI002F35A9A5
MERRKVSNGVEHLFKSRRKSSNEDSSEKSDHSVSGLGLGRFNVTCCSDIYSSAGKSLEVSSSPETTYIYAESIQACDTSCSNISQDCESVCLYRENESMDNIPLDHVSVSNQDCSLEAVVGSDCSTDNDSDLSCSHEDWKRNFNSYDDLYHSLHSLVEAQWGSASSQCDSEASGYTTDYDSESSFCNLDQQTGLNFADFDSLDARFEQVSWDLYNSFTQSSNNGNDMTSDIPGLGVNPEPTLGRLQGVVTLLDRSRFSTFFCEMMKEAVQDKNEEKQLISEGFLFHPQQFLQVKNSEYREGREYSFLRHIQNGSYGDVFSVRDKQTGFTCAAKRIPLGSFSWAEVGTWSRLDSPRVLQLYGAVREGLNMVLFMDLKTGSVAQLLKERSRLAEDLALYYHCQVLQALEHLHSRNVIHLDVKVDNVLLSKDGRQCFLCDFGLSEMLDQTGYSTKTFKGNGLRGTESHMSPEVARGDARSCKADVWSSCCMLLHMLSGHQPWTRFYTHPLCLKIVSEPAPLWEIPPGCDPLTCDVISGGLVKDPRGRNSVKKLLEKSTRALHAVGDLSDPVLSATNRQCSPPLRCQDISTITDTSCPSSTTKIPHQEKCSPPRIQWVSMWRERAVEEDGTDSELTDSDEESDEDADVWIERFWGKGEDFGVLEETDQEVCAEERISTELRSLVHQSEKEADEDEESDLDSLRELGSDWAEEEWEPVYRLQKLYGTKQQRVLYTPSEDECSETEEEWLPSRGSSTKRNLPESNSILTLTCHRSICTSEPELTEKDSDCSDDLSSGVFSSYSSIKDEQSFNVDWSVSTNQPPSCCFEGLGVDIWVEDVNGDTFRIRERLRVKLGHVAVGISSQISMRTFSLATIDGKLVCPDTEVLESGLWLLCVPAPDDNTSWHWRIRDGKMEMQELEELLSDTCSTLAV